METTHIDKDTGGKEQHVRIKVCPCPFFKVAYASLKFTIRCIKKL